VWTEYTITLAGLPGPTPGRFAFHYDVPNGGAAGLQGDYIGIDSVGFTPAPIACYPDCNQDTVLDVSDFGCFTNKFILNDPYADCNADGVLDVTDFGCFANKFILGCP
jgi:hypothetical protein